MKAQLSFSVNSPFTLLPRTTRAADLRVRESAWLGFGDELGRSSSNLSPSTESSRHPLHAALPNVLMLSIRMALIYASAWMVRVGWNPLTSGKVELPITKRLESHLIVDP